MLRIEAAVEPHIFYFAVSKYCLDQYIYKKPLPYFIMSDSNKNNTSFKIYKITFALVIISSMFVLSGCGREYVCYNGAVQKNVEDCPVLPTLALTDFDAQRIADNYGFAVATAKQDSYTRVNTYTKNSTWYANVLFTNIKSGNIVNVLLKISGQTGDISCVTGCDYFNTTKIEKNITVENPVDNTQNSIPVNS